MPRKKGTANGNGDNASRSNFGKPDSRDFHFVNIPLSDDDMDAMEQSTATVEYLFACLLDIFRAGNGITMRMVDAGKSCCITVVRSDPSGSSGTIAYASFGATERDACLASVYKYNVCLEGDTANLSKFVTPLKQDRRFR